MLSIWSGLYHTIQNLNDTTEEACVEKGGNAGTGSLYFSCNVFYSIRLIQSFEPHFNYYLQLLCIWTTLYFCHVVKS